MKSLILSAAIILCLNFNLLGQQEQLNGEYSHRKKGVFYSTYHFDKDNFSSIQSGDLGTFYGKGKYELNKNTLILSFDTSNLDRTKLKGYSIMEPKVDSLTLKRIDKRSFEIEYTLHNGTKYFEGYTRRK
jgi:hypothetical protein